MAGSCMRQQGMRLVVICACALLLVGEAGGMSGASPRNSGQSKRVMRQVNVRDAIRAPRILHDYGTDPVRLSPSGERYLLVLERGDLARNGTWVELFVGNTTSLSAARPKRVANLFSRSTAQASDLIKNIRWFDHERCLAFLWDDARHPASIVAVNTRTHKMATLVRHSTPIRQYDVSADGRTVVFSAEVPPDLKKIAAFQRKGFAIGEQSIWALLQGNLDGSLPGGDCETFVATLGGDSRGNVGKIGANWKLRRELLQISPSGRYAVAVGPASKVPIAWEEYTEQVLRNIYLPQALEHPEAPNWVRQYFLIDTEDRTVRPLWDAPENPRGTVLWSADSKQLIIGPTFLPIHDADATGLAGLAVVDLDVSTGKVTRILASNAPSKLGYHPIRWRRDGALELADVRPGKSNAESGIVVRFLSGTWQAIPSGPRPPVVIEVRQSLNIPPALYAVEATTGREKLLFEVNPSLERNFQLAKVKLVHWVATDGEPWSGLLYYPLHFEPGCRYPLVIQTHGYSPTDFSLDGGFTTVFAAQPLASHDIATLQVGGPDRRSELGTTGEARLYMAGYEGAIRHFIESGLVDSKKIGIVGFSRTGWVVEYMLTHSQVKLAAAVVADNIDGSYVQYVLDGSAGRAFDEADKGAPPFDKGLQAWFREAPGFNADRIQTPLRIELDSGPIISILSEWEMFSNLKYLKRPVELFVIPEIEHGVHILQNPAQRLASQGGTVDWFCFWLKNEEDSDPAKAGQYARWRELRKLGEADQPAHQRP